jgi:hypothetical protein
LRPSPGGDDDVLVPVLRCDGRTRNRTRRRYAAPLRLLHLCICIQGFWTTRRDDSVLPFSPGEKVVRSDGFVLPFSPGEKVARSDVSVLPFSPWEKVARSDG